MAKYCGKCGRVRDARTGLCPYCDAGQNQQTGNQYGQKTTPRQNTGWNALSNGQKALRITLRIVVWVLLMAALTLVGLGVLVSYEIVDIPVISDILRLSDSSAPGDSEGEPPVITADPTDWTWNGRYETTTMTEPVDAAETSAPTVVPTMEPTAAPTEAPLPTPLILCEVLEQTNDGEGQKDVVLGAWKDSFGNRHANAVKFWVIDRVGWANSEHIVFALDEAYRKLEGVISCGEDSESASEMTINIYLDDRLVYQSDVIDIGTAPFEYSIDVTNARTIRIECITDTNCFGHAIVTGELYR